MADYYPSFPHGSIEEIADNIFMVRGSIKMNPLITITRNMAIIRSGNELSVINPLRLNNKGEEQLRALGNVANIFRLGAFHGVDDPYYVDNFKARLWAQVGGLAYKTPAIDVELSADTALPFEGGKIFEFEGTLQPECALLLSSRNSSDADKDGEGLLLTCDAIQNYGDYSYNNLLAKLMMPFIGFPRTTIVGPMWLKLMTPEGGNLESSFRKLLELKFSRLLSGHGTLLTADAHAAVSRAVQKAFQS